MLVESKDKMTKAVYPMYMLYRLLYLRTLENVFQNSCLIKVNLKAFVRHAFSKFDKFEF